MKHKTIIEEIAMADLRNGHTEQKMQELIERYVGVEDYETAAGIRDACKNNKYVKCALFLNGYFRPKPNGKIQDWSEISYIANMIKVYIEGNYCEKIKLLP